MKSLRIAATTLGCKVNQVETASLLERFEEKRFRITSFKDAADVYLVNTCAVTARAAYESRQLIRRALKKRPLLVVATGCYVQIGAKEILDRVEGPVLLVGQDRKAHLVEIVSQLELPLKESRVLVGDISQERSCFPFPLRRFPGHHRAFLRVQDGCNAFCAYCVVPFSRGPARSLPLEEVLRQAERFQKEGYQEIVLTGIHLGLWGQDLSPPKDLVDLLKALIKTNPPRLRLSSLHPTEVNKALLDLAEESGIICPHFHLSLQSGDDEVLAQMGRNYTAGLFEEVVWEIKRRFPEAALGADVIAGFPTESEEAFRRTYELLRRLPISYLHVFPYSPRPRTRAATWPLLPPDKVAKRARALQELARAKKKAFYSAQVGRVLKVLVERRYDPKRGLYQGLSENYVVVHFSGPPGLEGSILPVRVERLVNEILLGTIVWSQKPLIPVERDLRASPDVF